MSLPNANKYLHNSATRTAHTLGVLEGYRQVLHTLRLRVRRLTDANPQDLAPRLEELKLHIRLYEDQLDRMMGQPGTEEPLSELFGNSPS